MATKLSFIDKVAVITGGGRGLGRQYALLFGSRGASVVVNDLGGGKKGEDKSHSAADDVVEEVKRLGGKAVANYDSVLDGDKIIKTAIDAFGRVDILINNAGILRDKSFIKMTDHDWDLIYQVHLLGAFKVSRAAWPYMKDQQYGRIIMTASGAGIYGNFGQANYSSAKMALIGLSNTLAVEGGKYGIHSNVIIPVAASRLTEDVLPPEFFEKFDPKYVAPVVAWLCHDDCKDSGQVFQTAGGWVGKYEWRRSMGVTLPATDKMTVELVKENWDKISDMTDAAHPLSVQEDLVYVAGALADPIDVDDSGDGQSTTINIAKALKTKLKPIKFQYQAKDAILYALGVGCSVEKDLSFLYEGHENFQVLPTYAIIPAQRALLESGALIGGIAGLPIDLTKVLHGEQYLEVYKPIPSSGVLKSQLKVTDVLDKGSSAVILFDADTYDEQNNLLCKNQFTIFVVGSGGFGGKRNSTSSIPTQDAPKRAPDATARTKTNTDQPAVYRLSGDINPMHIDANFAAMGGFSRPILHGLCTLGIVSRQVLEKFAANDVTKFKGIKVRFIKPVYPGETIETKMWREGNRVFIESSVPESGNVVLKGGYVDLTAITSHHISANKTQSATLKSKAVFEELKQRIAASSDLVNAVKGIFEWIILKNGTETGKWTVDLKNPPGDVYEGAPKAKADVTLTLEDDDMVEIVAGKLNPQKAFMTKKLKIKGNIMLTQKLQKLFQSKAKL